MRAQNINLILYMAKCCAACLIAYLVAPFLSEGDDTWFFISTVLVLSLDNREAMPLAITRIKANLMASAVSLVLLLAHLPTIVGICIGFCVIIALCNYLRLMLGVRPALAAVIIVMQHPSVSDHLWSTAAERALYVVAGCLTGLMLTIIFHRTFIRKKTPEQTSEE